MFPMYRFLINGRSKYSNTGHLNIDLSRHSGGTLISVINKRLCGQQSNDDAADHLGVRTDNSSREWQCPGDPTADSLGMFTPRLET